MAGRGALSACRRERNGLSATDAGGRARPPRARSARAVHIRGPHGLDVILAVRGVGDFLRSLQMKTSMILMSALSRFVDDGRLCMSNNAAERALRGIAVGRHNWTFARSDEGGRRAAAIHTLIETAKLNDVDPQAWLTDVLARLHDHSPSESTSSCPGIGSRCACKEMPCSRRQS